MAKAKASDSIVEDAASLDNEHGERRGEVLESAGLAKKPKKGGWVSIYVQRADDIVYELVEVRGGETNVIVRDAFSIVMNRAQNILQTMAEGGDV